jgi:hypothetical protein
MSSAILVISSHYRQHNSNALERFSDKPLNFGTVGIVLPVGFDQLRHAIHNKATVRIRYRADKLAAQLGVKVQPLPKDSERFIDIALMGGDRRFRDVTSLQIHSSSLLFNIHVYA